MRKSQPLGELCATQRLVKKVLQLGYLLFNLAIDFLMH